MRSAHYAIGLWLEVVDVLNRPAKYLEWRDGSKRRRLSVGKNAADAGARRLAKEAELNAINHGVAVAPQSTNGRRSLAAAVTDFLDETKLTKKPKTFAAYSTALSCFVESCPKLYLEDIDHKDLLKFAAFLRATTTRTKRLAAFTTSSKSS